MSTTTLLILFHIVTVFSFLWLHPHHSSYWQTASLKSKQIIQSDRLRTPEPGSFHELHMTHSIDSSWEREREIERDVRWYLLCLWYTNGLNIFWKWWLTHRWQGRVFGALCHGSQFLVVTLTVKLSVSMYSRWYAD